MLIVVPGLIWLTLAGVMVLSLASAAQGSMPQPLPFSPSADPRDGCRPSPDGALDDTADQRALLDIPAPANPVVPAPQSNPENARR